MSCTSPTGARRAPPPTTRGWRRASTWWTARGPTSRSPTPPGRSTRPCSTSWSRGPPPSRCYSFAPNADDLTARAQGPQGPEEEARDPWPQVRQGPQEARRRPAAARRLHACLHDHAEEAELRAAQGRPCAPDQRHGGHGVHPRRGPQPAGALRRARARWPRQGSAGRALQGRPRDARRRRCLGPQEGALPVRREGQVVPRRAAATQRPIEPDAIHRSKLVQQVINKVMLDGKKSTAERTVYDALAILSERTGKDPVEALETSIKALTPVLEVKSRRVGGATYQVPVEGPPPRARPPPLRPRGAAAPRCGRCVRGAPRPPREVDGAAARQRAARCAEPAGRRAQAQGRHLPHGAGEQGVRPLPLVAPVAAPPDAVIRRRVRLRH